MRKKIRQGVMLGAMIVALTIPQIVSATGFTDVSPDKWYYQDIKEAKEKRIISGYEDKTYKPEKTVSKVEALKIVVEGKTGGDIQLVESQVKWYTKYINYGREKDIDVTDIEGMQRPITREEVAEYIVKVYDKEVEESKGLLQDSTSKYIERLYQDKIMLGVGEKDGKREVLPGANLTRAEMAALINRVMGQEDNKTKEVKEKIEEEEIKARMPKHIMKNKVETPQIQKEFEAELLDMIKKREFERTIEYRNIVGATNKENAEIDQAFKSMYRKYPEYMGYTNIINIGTRIKSIRPAIEGSDKDITIKLNTGSTNKEKKTKKEMLDIFEIEAKSVVQDLIKKGALHKEQTEKEKAKEVYKWVIQNTKYVDSGYGEAFTGYGQITKGESVCQGYVATYNYILRLLGIEVEGVSGYASGLKGEERHIWTKAILDGKEVLIDVTFGDPLPDRGDGVDYTYFDIAENNLRKTHRW